MRTPASLILEAVQAKLTDAQEKLTAIVVTSASAQAAWTFRKEVHGFKRGDETILYDEAEHEKVRQAYQRDADAALDEVAAWQEALRVAIERFM